MVSNLGGFLVHLSVSPKAHAAFERDAREAVRDSGLSAEAQAALLSKDPGKIRDVILRERGINPGVAAAGDIEVVLVIVI